MENVQSNQQAMKDARGRIWTPRWWAILLIGLALWGAAVGTMFLTQNIILLPTIVLLGSFLVPLTAIAWYLDHDGSLALSPRRILSAFVIAGGLGLIVASLLEFWLVYGPGPSALAKGR